MNEFCKLAGWDVRNKYVLAMVLLSVFCIYTSYICIILTFFKNIKRFISIKIIVVGTVCQNCALLNHVLDSHNVWNV